jgi:3-dehydroquinate dehydratase-2
MQHLLTIARGAVFGDSPSAFSGRAAFGRPYRLRADAIRPSKSPIIHMPKHTIYVLNGPNLNLLGQRQPQLYGSATLHDIQTRLEARAAGLGLAIDFRQSNHEGVLIDWVHEARQKASAIIINAAGLTHSSVALLDALLAADLPVIEVHLTNIYRRDAFRHHSYVSQAATGIICGLGAKGYELALDALAERLQADVEKLDV